MENIRWYAMPAGFFGRVSVVQIKMRFKAEGIAVISILLDALSLSRNGRIRGALNSAEGLDESFLSAIAELSGSRREVVGEVLGLLVDDGTLFFDEQGLGCSFIDSSLCEQEDRRRKGAERQKRYRANSNALRNGDVTVTSPVTLPLRNGGSNAHSNSNVTATYRHIDIYTDRQTETSGSASAARSSSCLSKNLNGKGGPV